MFGLIRDWLRMSGALRKIAPKETGMNIEKEKLKAFMGDSPKNKAAKIVKPDLEIAGRIAKAWKQPIIKADK